MTSTIDKFQDAYATLTVAVYEPLILSWVSGWSILTTANTMAWRVLKSKYINLDDAVATAHALGRKLFRSKIPLPDDLVVAVQDNMLSGTMVAQPIKVVGFPDALIYNGAIHLTGLNNVTFKSREPAENQKKGKIRSFFSRSGRYVSAQKMNEANVLDSSTPVIQSKRMGTVEKDFDFVSYRDQLYKNLIDASKLGVQDGENLHHVFMQAFKNINGVDLFDFLPTSNIDEALSPIGVAHYYRQLYFNLDEGFGPIEHCFTVAPKETLEVIVASTRRQIHEEIIEIGHEEISEQATEERNMDEVSDKVSSMLQRDMSASMSINGSFSTPVWQVGASAQASMAVSSQRSRETATKRLKDVTKRASERITKSYSIKTRDYEELTDSTTTRRVISNENDAPVNYALRRIYRRVRVKIQELGPRAVWQLYLRNPGSEIAMSRFVHFRESAPISMPEIPPGVPARPEGGIETGSTSCALKFTLNRGYFVTIKVITNADRRITAVSIDSLTDLESNSKDDPAPSAANDLQWGGNWNEATNTYTVNIPVVAGDSASISVGYTYGWEPSQKVLDEWETKRSEAVAKLEEEHLIEQFERNKKLITERSKIRPRPSNELRREERYEAMNRMVDHLFGRGDDPSEPTPLEIECYHRYFDIEAMFIYTHPSWWKPRFHPVGVMNGRPAYEITAESEPAKLGSSLGWKIQLDGDNRRNEFINSPWLRICLPIKPDREEEAIRWLAKHVEGDIGFNLNSGPLKTILDDIRKRRSNENNLGKDSYDYVTITSTVGAPSTALTPEKVFPIIDEFDVTLPTEGFIYDEILIKDEGVNGGDNGDDD